MKEKEPLVSRSQLIDDLKRALEPTDEEIAAIEKRVRATLLQPGVHREPRHRAVAVVTTLAVAAAVTVVVGARLRHPAARQIVTSPTSGPVASEHLQRFEDGTQITWFGHTHDVRVVTEGRERVTVEVLRGTARFNVAARPERVFTVTSSVGAQTVTTEVVGTNFEQAVSATSVTVRVHSGLVLTCVSPRECAPLVAGRELSFPGSGTAPFQPRDNALFDTVQWSIENGHAGDGTLALERFVTTPERRAEAAQKLLDLGDRLRREQHMAEAAAAYDMSARVHPDGALAPHARLRARECLDSVQTRANQSFQSSRDQ